MDLEIEEVADLLNVPVTTIDRLITAGKIPAYKMSDRYRFNRNEIENWMMQKEPEISKEEQIYPLKEGEKDGRSGWQHFSLYRAMNKGGVHSDIEGTTKEEVIAHTMDKLAEELDLDAKVLTDLLLDRERLMPTSLNSGVAVPHTRDFLLQQPFDVVATVYLQSPIDYGALDREPVHTLFFLFAASDKRHLHLLAKLAHLCTHNPFVERLQSRPDKDELLEDVRKWEITAHHHPR